MTSDEVLVRKYEDLYKVTKEIFEREIKRDGSVEEKALRYLTVIGLLIAAAGYVTKEPLAGIVLPLSEFEYIVLLFILGFWLTLLSAAIIIFRVLSIRDIHVPFNKGIVEYYDENSYLDILYASSLNHVELDQKNQIQTNRRARLLIAGHYFILSAILIFAVITGLTMTKAWIKTKNQHTVNQLEVNEDATQKEQ